MTILSRIQTPEYVTCEIGTDDYTHGKARGPQVTKLFGKYEVIFSISLAANNHELADACNRGSLERQNSNF